MHLAAIGPELARLGAELEHQAQAQAQRTRDIATSMRALTEELSAAVGSLRQSSQQAEAALATVARIAEFTRIISLNASIEAARAGESGRAFAVVVGEVQQLADPTGTTAHTIEARMRDMHGHLRRVAQVAGPGSATIEAGRAGGPATATDGAARPATRSVEEVNLQLQGMTTSTEQQRASAARLHQAGDTTNALTESLLLAVGRFRFALHRQVEEEVIGILPVLGPLAGDRAACEAHLSAWLEQHPHFELAYLTDAEGRQYIDNLCRRGEQIEADPAGRGRDWSERPWFLAALEEDSIAHSTDIYRSAATQDFCFTVAAALRDETGGLCGVLGADVNFQKLVVGATT